MTVTTPAVLAAFRLTTVLPVRYVPARLRPQRKTGATYAGPRTLALRSKLKALEAQGFNRKQIIAAANVSHVTVRKHLGKVNR